MDSLATVREFAADAAERAVRTFAQTLLGVLGVGQLDLLHVPWTADLSIAGGAALLSLLTSLGGAFTGSGTASLTRLLVPRSVHEAELASADYGRHTATVTDWDSGAGHAEQGEPDDEQWLAALRDQATPTRRTIPETVVPGKPLGRHVNHDPRSLSFLVPETDTPTTAVWQRRVPVFDQGDLGSCTGNAAAGVLGTDPFYETLPTGLTDDENEAVSLYSAATRLDGYTGAYPPDDTGSDGLSVAKACKQAGLISGYQHITSVRAAHTAIKTGPFIVGSNWYDSMDEPGTDGLVTVSGTVRGGHEYECHGYDATADLWWFTNSWGASWGKQGTFCMSSASFARLLSEQGDATVFLPIAAPAPPAPPTPIAPPADVVAWAKRVTADAEADKTAAADLLHWLGLA